MKKKFHFLRFVVVLLRILAFVLLLAGIAGLVAGLLLKPGGEQAWLRWAAIGGGIFAFVVGLLKFVALWAIGDLIRVKLATERNTRRAAEELARLKSIAPTAAIDAALEVGGTHPKVPEPIDSAVQLGEQTVSNVGEPVEWAQGRIDAAGASAPAAGAAGAAALSDDVGAVAGAAVEQVEDVAVAAHEVIVEAPAVIEIPAPAVEVVAEAVGPALETVVEAPVVIATEVAAVAAAPTAVVEVLEAARVPVVEVAEVVGPSVDAVIEAPATVVAGVAAAAALAVGAVAAEPPAVVEVAPVVAVTEAVGPTVEAVIEAPAVVVADVAAVADAAVDTAV
ncbi:MAG TPA: hypothetical protein VM537_06125, partial [Anaerolineae bacterium]|nr:hypothetical protein [Anaerolineae bacterium]